MNNMPSVMEECMLLLYADGIVLIFTHNNMPSVIECVLLLYADDIVLMCSPIIICQVL